MTSIKGLNRSIAGLQNTQLYSACRLLHVDAEALWRKADNGADLCQLYITSLLAFCVRIVLLLELLVR